MSPSGPRTSPHRTTTLIALIALLALAVGSASAMARSATPQPLTPLFQSDATFSPESREITSVIVQNASSATATIGMEFSTPGGLPIEAARQVIEDVPGWNTRTFEQAFNTGLLPGFRGVGVVTSTQPINALLVREVTSADGLRSYAIQNTSGQGATRMTLPYVANQLRDAASGGSISTRFSVANSGAGAACVSISYRLIPGRGAVAAGDTTMLVSGGVVSATCPDGGIEIPVGGQVTLSPEGGELALAMPAGTVNALMSVLIDSTQPVTVSADIYRGDGSGAQLGSYSGLVVGEADAADDDASTQLVMPLAQKSTDGYWTEYAITNPWDEAVAVSILYTGRVAGETGRYGAEMTFEAPAGGGIVHSVLDTEALPAGFVGSAIIRADRPVTAVLLRGKMTGFASFVHEHTYSAVGGVPAERATDFAKIPLVFRRAHGTDGSDGLNSWVSVAVADGGKATLNIVTVNDPSSGARGCNLPWLYRLTTTIEDSFLFDQSSRSGRRNGLGDTPDCLTGGMVITSDRPIVAIGAITSDQQAGDNEGVYTAFP